VSISPDDLARLEAAARAASRHAYCPYSGYAVGAAVLTGTGRVFAASNVENASYGLSSCAERNAVFQAVAAGERSVRAMVLYTPTLTPGAPCGACRQVLHEFAAEASVHACCDGEARCSWELAELLPHAFGPETLNGR
jgi:cytidine deaminase